MATHIVFVLDRSGSMGGLENDVIGGFNSFLRDQKKLKGKAKMTVVLFDDRYEVLINAIDLQLVPEITSKEYFVRGMTALLDAVGKTINVVKDASKKKDKIIFLINTDGLENYSREFTSKKVIADMIKECEKERKWKFVFFGAGIDAFAEGGSIGINAVSTYTHTGGGTQAAYATASSNISQMRQGGTVTDAMWVIKEDNSLFTISKAEQSEDEK